MGRVKVIRIDNAPVNAMNKETRKLTYGSIKSAVQDENVTAILLCGAGRTFCGGADITEFNSKYREFPTLTDIVELLESSSKPTIAAIHGYALGGGLELALGCHYRIAVKSAKLGLPEVKLGVLPAATGTQRLPRLTGLDVALEWIVSGRHYSSQEALQYGVIDSIRDSFEDFFEFADELLRTNPDLSQRRVSCLPVKDAADADAIYSKHLERLQKKMRGYQYGPMACLKATKLAVGDYTRGKKEERRMFDYLRSGSQSNAMRYVFFGEKQAKKWTTLDGLSHANTIPLPIKRAGVLGLGTMGSGIVISLLQLGIPVWAMEMNVALLHKNILTIKKLIARMQKLKLISQDQCSQMQSMIVPCYNYSQLNEVDIIIEAVFESMKLKLEVFKQLDKHCKPSCILASNTSTMDIDAFAAVTSRPDKVIGMHFFAPAHVMKLLENVRGEKTSPETIATAMDIGIRMKKATILVGNCHGFVVNRMYFLYIFESMYLLEEGCYPQDVDAALKDYGFAMGRFETGDLSGNDVYYRVAESTGELL